MLHELSNISRISFGRDHNRCHLQPWEPPSICRSQTSVWSPPTSAGHSPAREKQLGSRSHPPSLFGRLCFALLQGCSSSFSPSTGGPLSRWETEGEGCPSWCHLSSSHRHQSLKSSSARWISSGQAAAACSAWRLHSGQESPSWPWSARPSLVQKALAAVEDLKAEWMLAAAEQPVREPLTEAGWEGWSQRDQRGTETSWPDWEGTWAGPVGGMGAGGNLEEEAGGCAGGKALRGWEWMWGGRRWRWERQEGKGWRGEASSRRSPTGGHLEGSERRETEGELPFRTSSRRSLVRAGAKPGQFELPSNTFRAIRDVKSPLHRTQYTDGTAHLIYGIFCITNFLEYWKPRRPRR